MIQYGDTNSIPELKKLWKVCFADEDAYIQAFFDALYEDHNVLMEKENGVLMGASFFLPGEICLEHSAEHLKGCSGKLHAGRRECFGIQGEWQKIRYVYALAVYPQFRGRGIAGSLLQRAHEIYHAPLIAEPAEEGLVGGFYEPLGFSGSFYLKKISMEVPQYDVGAAEVHPRQRIWQDETAALQAAAADEYCRIRDTYFSGHGYVRWPAKHVAFALHEHCRSGGGAYVFHKDGREDAVLYYRDKQDMIVTETTLTEKEVMDLFLPEISKSCGRLILTSPAKQSDIAIKAVRTGQDEAPREQAGIFTEQRYCLTGMSYGLPSVYGYLNLSLD